MVKILNVLLISTTIPVISAIIIVLARLDVHPAVLVILSAGTFVTMCVMIAKVYEDHFKNPVKK